MSKFKIGDKVRVSTDCPQHQGEYGCVVNFPEDSSRVGVVLTSPIGGYFLFLERYLELADDPYAWHEAGLEVIYRWDLFRSASNPVDQASQLVELSNAISDLKSWLPGFDIETDTMPWDREEEL